MPPDHQAVWAVKVALAYFLIGLGSMLMVVSAVNDVRIAVPATGGRMESVKDTARFKVGI
ncbi:hypothetical protein SJAV_25840 [Sulfurisphaera javensis]|uniref:Uncharacterized protein n=1 Tax=Sulfurisphaera javensis TaxID=2049879 RepID=A0AAT9GUM9_9CREN